MSLAYSQYIYNNKNHKEYFATSCEMDCTVSKLYRIILCSVRHLCKQLVGILLFVWAGFY